MHAVVALTSRGAPAHGDREEILGATTGRLGSSFAEPGIQALDVALIGTEDDDVRALHARMLGQPCKPFLDALVDAIGWQIDELR
jgi:hypothetical protein